MKAIRNREAIERVLGCVFSVTIYYANDLHEILDIFPNLKEVELVNASSSCDINPESYPTLKKLMVSYQN